MNALSIRELAMVYIFRFLACGDGILFCMKFAKVFSFSVCVNICRPPATSFTPGHSGRTGDVVGVDAAILTVLVSGALSQIAAPIVQCVVVAMVNQSIRGSIHDLPVHVDIPRLSVDALPSNRIVGLRFRSPARTPIKLANLREVFDADGDNKVFSQRNMADGFVRRRWKRITEEAPIPARATPRSTFGFGIAASAKVVLVSGDFHVRNHNATET